VVAYAVTVHRQNVYKTLAKKGREKARFAHATPELLAEVVDHAAGPNTQEEDLYIRVMSAALDRLTGRVHRVFELVVIGGLTPKAAAKILDLSAGHVRRLLLEARSAVEQLIDEISSEPARTTDSTDI
jgi:RNA polymerase sigma factor (sigma-70 family)